MALLIGFLPNSTVSAGANPNLTQALDGFFGIVGWPAGESMGSLAMIQPLATHWPVEASGRIIEGVSANSYSDDFYHRIHIAPQSLDLGNVVSVQTTDVALWNSYLDPRTLLAIDGLDEGLMVSGQPAAPFLFQANQERIWQLSVTPDGQPVLDTVIEWVFDLGTAGLRVTANRITAWSFAPDWADGVRETLEWLTDILGSETLVEQRRALRIAPRRSLQASMYVEGRERQLLDLALYGWGSRVWALPIWPDIQLLSSATEAGALRINCQTTNLDFEVGGLAMLRGEDAFTYEVVEILSLDASGLNLKRGTQQPWPARSRLYPARPAQLMSAPQLTRLHDRLQSAVVRFLLLDTCDWPETLPAVLYRSRPVLDLAPEESEDLTSSYERLLSTLDSGMGLPLISDLAGKPMPITRWRWLELGRAQRAQLRALLYGLRGQQVPVWLPTHADDLTVVATIGALSTVMDIEYIGYTRFAQARAGRRDIRLQLWNGSVFYRRITGCTELSTSVERLVFDTALGTQVEPSDIARVSWMVLSRLSGDQVEIDHQVDSEGVASCSLTFRGVRDDEF